MTSNVPRDPGEVVEVVDGGNRLARASDEAVEMDVLSLDGGVARCVDDAGDGHDVRTELVDDVLPGDTLLVHAGVALSVIENAEHFR